MVVYTPTKQTMRVVKKGPVNGLSGTASSFLLGNANLWAESYALPSFNLTGGVNANTAFVQVLFKNRSNEIINSFQSLQENIQYCKLKYSREGGLKEAEFTVNYHHKISYYGDMLIEFRSNILPLGTVFSDSITLDNGLLTLKGYSAFERLGNQLKIKAESQNLTYKGTVIFFLRLIAEQLKASDNVVLFTVNPTRILVDDKAILESCFFIDKSPVEIMKGLATLGGKVVYGIDEYNQFYFIDQTKTEGQRWFANRYINDIELSTNDGAVVNVVNLYAKSQSGEKLSLITTYRDENSIAQYGIKENDVNLAFTLNAQQPQLYAKLFATPSPPVCGQFSIFQWYKPVSLGLHTVTNYLSTSQRRVFNSCKDIESFSFTNFTVNKVYVGFITGRYAFKFLGSGCVTVMGQCSGCTALVLAIGNTARVTVKWQSRGESIEYEVMALNRMRLVTLPAVAVDNTLILESEGDFVLDSISYLTSFVESHKGYYEAHELELVGNQIKTVVKIGQNQNDFVEQAKELQQNAKLLDSLLKSNL